MGNSGKLSPADEEIFSIDTILDNLENNKNVDSVLIDSKDVLGTVKYIVKYIGNPTIWMQETFKGRRK